MELGQVEQRRVHPKRILPVPLEISINLIPIGTRQKLDRGALGVGVRIPVRRRPVCKVEHGIDVAHENVSEEIVEVVLDAVEWWTKRVDADGVLTVMVDDPHRGTQFHRVDRVRDVSNTRVVMACERNTKRTRRTQR